MWRFAPLLLLFVSAPSCLAGRVDEALVPPPYGAPVVAEAIPADRATARSHVVLVVIDGARWQEIFRGVDPELGRAFGIAQIPAPRLLPHLYDVLASRGAGIGAPGHGDGIYASGPNFVSLPGYTEIFSGRPPTGCADNDCGAPERPTLVDELRVALPVPGDVAVFSSWPDIAKVAAWRSDDDLVVSSGRARTSGGHVLEEDGARRALLAIGARAAPLPGHDDFRPDRITAELALQYLETRRPSFLFLGLGETDEYGHRGDYRGYVDALRAADRTIGDLLATLGRMGERGAETTVIVTTDHGRARDFRQHGGQFPESARVWLVAAGPTVHARGFVGTAKPHRLADIAPTIRALFDLPRDASAKAGRVIDELFE